MCQLLYAEDSGRAALFVSAGSKTSSGGAGIQIIEWRRKAFIQPDAGPGINGWIKAELFMDFHVTGEKPVEQEIDEYIIFFNEQRPAYSLNYLTPKQYREAHAA